MKIKDFELIFNNCDLKQLLNFKTAALTLILIQIN